MTTISPYASCDSAAIAALGAALAAVEDSKQTGRLEREVSKAESELRKATLERAAKKLDDAATRQVVGAAVSGAFMLAAAYSQFQGAANPAIEKIMSAEAQLNQALSKTGDVISATAGFSQADKVRLDKLAESQQQAAQDAQRGRNKADEAVKQSLADARALLQLLRESAQATRRA